MHASSRWHAIFCSPPNLSSDSLLSAATPQPVPGRRLRVPLPRASRDAHWLVTEARTRKAHARGMLAIVCADAREAVRLKEEMPVFGHDLAIALLPDWETLPYDSLSPHPDLVSERLETLHRISAGAIDVLVVAATTALGMLCPPAYIAARTFMLKAGDRLDVAALKRQMTTAGYSAVRQVVSPGEFASRGGLLDLFPTGSAVPYRLDLDGETIESIKTFDVDSQRSIYPVREVRLLPAREFPFDEAARTEFRGRFREVFEGDPSRSTLYRDVGSGIAGPGVEYYLPLFFESAATLFDYLPASTLVVLHGPVDAAIAEFRKDTDERYRFLRGDTERPILPPTRLFLDAESFYLRLRDFAALTATDADPTTQLPHLAVDRRSEHPLAALSEFLAHHPGRVLVVAESAGRRETMLEMLAADQLRPVPCKSFDDFLAGSAHFGLCVAPLSAGFFIEDSAAPLALITETELYADGTRTRSRRDKRRETDVEGMLRDLSELKVGDPVVHREHGIGRYRGLANIDLGDGVNEFLELEYADATRLYVPVAQLSVIGRYSGASPEDAPLHRLGSDQWERARRRAAEAVRDTAAELLNLYARRASRQGHAFDFKNHDYEAFAAGFGFEETADQSAAIAQVIEDMRAGRPMDRLICGDVGFGKTEVALRAAFVAVAGGRQVALLCPTTLLAEQHHQTFKDRFADWPVKVAELSRFRNARESAAVLAGLADGSIDIVIGTHKLLSKDTRFARLGLTIIDEEHRFGVRQKEALKALRAEVDVLTLTATPIPRTLAMSLEGLRDFSVIATAPQKRVAIKTFVRREGDAVIREAVLRELKRGGQVYFLHNEVETIENQRERLARLLPEARIEIAHGQMPERELERVMRGFYQQRFNLLLCTTIIETGIDVPSANTILMHRADRFGLAQLHQLRGRVGRSHHQAYAYLLVAGEDTLTPAAKKRLEAIQAMEELGSGFFLAMHDLEIRGAGEVLGESQSGEMLEIGFSLYNEMLVHAVACLKSGREPDLSEPLGVVTEINLHAPALLPDDYCGDIHERLVLYKRLANCASAAALDSLFEELVDRFGTPPEAARTLLECHRLRIVAAAAGVLRVDAGPQAILLQFRREAPIDHARLVQLIQRDRNVRLAGQDRLRVTMVTSTAAERAQAVRAVLKAVA
ncbi:MAG: transcription-repair coupling factor [Burkholderiales bacterium]|nr:transcription-repair coupling factor [Burkholderiales bacterium]